MNIYVWHGDETAFIIAKSHEDALAEYFRYMLVDCGMDLEESAGCIVEGKLLPMGDEDLDREWPNDDSGGKTSWRKELETWPGEGPEIVGSSEW